MTISALLSWGVFASVPVVGGWLWPCGGTECSWTESLVRRCAAGIVFWSILLLAAAEGDFFFPAWLGGLGWLCVGVAGVLKAFRLRRSRTGQVECSRPEWAEIAVGAGLLAVFALNAAYHYEHAIGGRDMGVYANTAVHLARSGAVTVPLPVTAVDMETLGKKIFPPPSGYSPLDFPGFTPQGDSLAPQFSHLYPAWLGQAFAAGGPGALYRFNAAAALLAGLALFALVRRFASPWLACWSALFLALMPPQVWLSRITMSELLAQALLLSALWALHLACRNEGFLEWVWAGLLLGATGLVRPDLLAAAPMAMAGLGIWNWAHGWGDHPWARRAFAFVCLGSMVAVAAYYHHFCAAYYWGTLPIFRGAAGLAAIAGLLYLPLPKRVSEALSRTLLSRRLLLGVVGVLSLVAVYALLLRPHLGPFAVWHWPGHPLDGLRDYREDTLVNLTSYLTPLVLGATFLGVVVWIKRSQRRVEMAGSAAILSVVLGFAILFLYRPAIESSHLWAARRFSPVVFPGLLLLAAVGIGAVRDAVGGKAGSWIAGAWVLGASVLGGWVDIPWLLRQEYAGLHQQVAVLAEKAGKDRYLFVHPTGAFSPWKGTLYFMHGVPVLPVDLQDPEDALTFGAWVQREAAAGRSVALAAERTNLPQGFDGVPTESAELRYGYHKPTLKPPPAEWVDEVRNIRFFEVRRADFMGRVVGGDVITFFPGASEEGIWRSEVRAGAPPIRWTNGNASLRFPVDGAPPQALELWLNAGRNGGAHLSLSVQDNLLFDAMIPPGPWHGVFPLGALATTGTPLQVDLVSDSWVPAKEIPGSTDTRELGIVVSGLRLIPDGWRPSPAALPAAGLKAQILEMPPAATLRASAAEPAAVPLWIVNRGDSPWCALRDLGTARGAVRLGVKWFAPGVGKEPLAHGRVDLPYGLFPGEGVPVTLRLIPAMPDGNPLPPGQYTVVVQPLQELVQWFPPEGNSLTLNVEVIP